MTSKPLKILLCAFAIWLLMYGLVTIAVAGTGFSVRQFQGNMLVPTQFSNQCTDPDQSLSDDPNARWACGIMINPTTKISYLLFVEPPMDLDKEVLEAYECTPEGCELMTFATKIPDDAI